MADVEEDADFGSHFLDSMLEVEMTEEDNELDVSRNYDPLETLPPIPTFDLQSETFSYKNVYSDAIQQPVLATLPLASSTASNVPLVLKPNSMLIYSGDMPPLQPASVSPKISPKSNAKNSAKSVNTSFSSKNTTPDDEVTDEEFIKEVFRPEFVKHVFIRADPPSDISLVSEEEMKYYNTCFKDVKKVQKCRLHCTICDKHLGCAATAEKKINVHTMLKVLTCKPCFEFYGDGNFPCDKGDNCEIYCRWCGQGGALVCCSFCPRVFCKRCVKRNYGNAFLKTIEKATDWACFCCAQKPLWPHRAVCRALLEFITRKKTNLKVPHRDTSTCCRLSGLNRKKLQTPLDKGRGVSSSELKVNPAARSPDSRNKTLTPSKNGKEQLLLKPVVQLKDSDRVKTPNSDGNSKSGGINIFSPRSIVAGNSIIRGIATTAPAKLYSAYPSPQLIQSPVIHGETLITPPSRLLLQAKSPMNPPPGYNSSFVRVSLTHQAPNLDINKIPTVKIPHEVQGLVLRLIFPDNKMQYVRLASDGCKTSKDFPLPSFNENAGSFVEENLAEAFKISKTMYDKLSRILDKVNSRTSYTEESVFNSSVRKLHLAYKKAVDLYQELDRTLSKNHEEWKNETKTPVDVIDISDDETSTAKRGKANKYSGVREKNKKHSDDSDIEILDDNIMNGMPPNYKEKYRLRSSADQERAHVNDTGAVKKRKRGRLRKNNKRLKTARMQNGQPEEDPLKIETEVAAEDMKVDPDVSIEKRKLRGKDKIVLGGPEGAAGPREKSELTGEMENSTDYASYSWTETETTEIKTETLEIPSEEMEIENPGLVDNS